MKRIFYHMACWLAVLGCAACSNETDFVQPEADNNSIVLDISSATTPVTRAGATGAEVTVSYVDVLTRVRDKDCVKNRVKRAKIVRFTLC